MRAKRYISEKQAGQFLSAALRQDAQCLICRNGYTTHAAGIAIARFSLLDLSKKMRLFKNALDTNIGEFILETECILTKFCEHIIRFSNTQSLFKQLVDNDALSGSPGNSLKDAIIALSAGERFYKKHLSEFLNLFESNLQDIIKRISPIISEIATSNMSETKQKEALESAKWLSNKDPSIKKWFSQKKKDFSMSSDNFKKAIQVLNSILIPLQKDWEKDHALIQRQENRTHKAPSSFVFS